MTVTKSDIRKAISGLELSERPLCVHSSLRSFGWVEDGPRTVIDGLLAEGCTILVPTFTDFYMAQAPPGRRIAQNAWDYERSPQDWWITDRPYSPATDEVEEGMGAIPRAIAGTRNRARGTHPLMSLSSVGPLAQELVSGQDALNPLSPLDALIKHDGYLVLMGVGLDRMTLIHLAEERAGRRLFRRWAVNPGGPPEEVAYGGCSDGFGQLEPVLRPLVRKVQVGESPWTVYQASSVVEVVTQAILENPRITHCGKSGCRCDDAMLGGPIV